ncbi:MAG: tRNA 2-selenouridine(34) synthase MnmH [Bacteroidales bacterium]
MQKEIQVKEFLERSRSCPIVDVRSPGEYGKAHIPGAFNLALFTDEERAKVGITYKQKGREKAVIEGLEIVGPKLKEFAQVALSLKSKKLLLYCWRGGMRSSSMAWLLKQVGIEVELLSGGYKSYRNFVLSNFEEQYKLLLLGGYTGAGKSSLLKELELEGEQIIDLERLANHKGSAFGAIGEVEQHSNEMFENLLFKQLSALNPNRPIWVEDESRNIGRNFIPNSFWLQMRSAPIIIVESSFEERLGRLIEDYGYASKESLITSINKIEKRLGYDRCKEAVEACKTGELKYAAEICLTYYDKAYSMQLEKRFGSTLEIVPKFYNRLNRGEGELPTLIDISKKIYGNNS